MIVTRHKVRGGEGRGTGGIKVSMYSTARELWQGDSRRTGIEFGGTEAVSTSLRLQRQRAGREFDGSEYTAGRRRSMTEVRAS